MEQHENTRKQYSKYTEKMTLPNDPKTGKPYTAKEIAKVLLNTKPEDLGDWREEKKKE